MIEVNVTVFFGFFFCLFVFKCLNVTISLTCILANKYPSSNEISKKNGTVGARGLYRLRCLVLIHFYSKYLLVSEKHLNIYNQSLAFQTVLVNFERGQRFR